MYSDAFDPSFGALLFDGKAAFGCGNGSGWWNDKRFFDVVGGIQYLTVWTPGVYQFTVAGSSSFGPTFNPRPFPLLPFPLEAVVTGSYALAAGQVVAFLVGQPGLVTFQHEPSFTGGGGSFVALVPGVGNLTGAVPLFVAGGAGALGSATLGHAGSPASPLEAWTAAAGARSLSPRCRVCRHRVTVSRSAANISRSTARRCAAAEGSLQLGFQPHR